MTRVEFDEAFDLLCTKKIDWSMIPTVSNILLAYPHEFIVEKNIVLKYFIQEFGKDRSPEDIKFQEYVNFIRLERNKKFNVDFKVKSRKFISNSCFTRCVLKRSSTIYNYYTEYIMLQNSIPYSKSWWK